MSELLQVTNKGLYCADGDFYIDPWRSVERAVITHGHSDHARPGMKRYLCSRESELILRIRVGEKSSIDTLPYGEEIDIDGVRLSLHPAGHILGSAQVRVERRGEVAVVSGDYKTEADWTCTPYEPIRCHTFITESTFGLPIYRWAKEGAVFEEVNDWRRENARAGKASVLLGYSLGKAQRVLAGLEEGLGPIVLHPALDAFTNAYRLQGVKLPSTTPPEDVRDWSKASVIAPPGVLSTQWITQVGEYATTYLSGWMAVPSTRKARAVDRGFVLSDHVDWPSLMEAIDATGAERVFVTHGYSAEVVRFLRGRGMEAHVLGTEWTDDQAGAGETA